MNLRNILWSCVAALVCATACADETNITARAGEAVTTNLSAEIKHLREENRKLREELVQGAAAAHNKAKLTAEATASSTSTNNAVLYWVTSGSEKRHNPSCRYYKQSKGYLTPRKEGTPCKLCGG